jgi:hypothetical protein
MMVATKLLEGDQEQQQLDSSDIARRVNAAAAA